jgi:hypothetical protein
MQNPIYRKRGMIRRSRYRSREPYKISLLRRISYEISTERMIGEPEKVRKAMREIVNDDKLWEMLKTFSVQVKQLAKWGIEQGC